METILIHTESKEQIKVFEQMAKALKVPFEIKQGSPYKPEFVEMVRQADKDFKKGKGKKVKLDDIWK
ncbi:hypothetical protein EFY79_04090 [Hanamia caeni]|jgi:arginyl-tRNA synthetase|uniref:Uncharacterized protein n=1 Tax=Hanamia caeni TaxID=2294116 RepID=A0A3M9NM30_9BACT|nr:DUF2683 family protein [Hanamia caeni]RNI38850.1 hypothetical protein EFY79_04090 [Hanamia caeni]